MNVMPTRIKHCGITTVEDAHLAAEAGAWALGMIFWAGSPRRCELDEAQLIGTALRRTVHLTGVFVNARLEEIDLAVATAGLEFVQLHGDEGPVFCSEVARRTGAKVIKAVRVQSRATLQAAAAYHTDFLLLDAHVDGVPGGTGQTIDWNVVRKARLVAPVILSGGLNAGQRRDRDRRHGPVRRRRRERHGVRPRRQGSRASCRRSTRPSAARRSLPRRVEVQRCGARGCLQLDVRRPDELSRHERWATASPCSRSRSDSSTWSETPDRPDMANMTS